MATNRHSARAIPPTSDRETVSRRFLKSTAVVARHTITIVRHAATAIGWLSYVWFNFALPLAILLAGIAIMIGLILLTLVQITPDYVNSVPEFTYWMWDSD